MKQNLRSKKNIMTAINPYLDFNGNAEEASNFYKSVFGGEFAMVSRRKDIPANTEGCEAMSLAENEQEKII